MSSPVVLKDGTRISYQEVVKQIHRDTVRAYLPSAHRSRPPSLTVAKRSRRDHARCQWGAGWGSPEVL